MKTDLVVAAYIVHNSRVLLVRHRKLGLWLPPGGHIEEDETPDNAVRREVREELNIEVEFLNRPDAPAVGNTKRILATPFRVDVHSVGDHDHCCLYYLCTPKSLDLLKHNKLEVKDFAWFSPDDLEGVSEDVKGIGLKALELSAERS